MRAGFGLIAILVFLGVTIWIWSKSTLPYTQQVLKQGEVASKQVNQIAGNSTDGKMRFEDSATIESQKNGSGHVDSLLVTNVVAGGPAETYFGLKRGDVITQIDSQGSMMKVRDWEDGEMARLQVIDAYSKQRPIVVSRDGQEITLPISPSTQQPAKAPSLQDQLNTIQRAPGGR